MSSLSMTCRCAVRSLAPRPTPLARKARVSRMTVRAASGLDGLKGAKHVHADEATLGCPDSESGMCDHVPMRAHDALLGSPDSITGMISTDFDALEVDATPRHAVHKVGGHLIHSQPMAMGCPDSETGVCEMGRSESDDDQSLGAWDF